MRKYTIVCDCCFNEQTVLKPYLVISHSEYSTDDDVTIEDYTPNDWIKLIKGKDEYLFCSWECINTFSTRAKKGMFRSLFDNILKKKD